MFRCVHPGYDRFGDEPYETVEAFLAMCNACFGEAPELVERMPGHWWEVERLPGQPKPLGWVLVLEPA